MIQPKHCRFSVYSCGTDLLRKKKILKTQILLRSSSALFFVLFRVVFVSFSRFTANYQRMVEAEMKS